MRNVLPLVSIGPPWRLVPRSPASPGTGPHCTAGRAADAGGSRGERGRGEQSHWNTGPATKLGSLCYLLLLLCGPSLFAPLSAVRTATLPAATTTTAVRAPLQTPAPGGGRCALGSWFFRPSLSGLLLADFFSLSSQTALPSVTCASLVLLRHLCPRLLCLCPPPAPSMAHCRRDAPGQCLAHARSLSPLGVAPTMRAAACALLAAACLVAAASAAGREMKRNRGKGQARAREREGERRERKRGVVASVIIPFPRGGGAAGSSAVLPLSPSPRHVAHTRTHTTYTHHTHTIRTPYTHHTHAHTHARSAAISCPPSPSGTRPVYGLSLYFTGMWVWMLRQTSPS